MNYYDEDDVFDFLFGIFEQRRELGVTLRAKIKHRHDVTLYLWSDRTVTYQYPENLYELLAQERKTRRQLFEEISD